MPTVPKFYLDLLNQLFALEKKLADQPENRSLLRPVERMKRLCEESLPLELEAGQPLGLVLHNPYGEKYADTRTDVEASVAGAGSGRLHIVEVLKPIIYLRGAGFNRIVQKGIVIVE